MAQIGLYKFQGDKNKFKKALRWLLECILPCTIAFVAFQYIAYCFPTMIVEHAQIKGLDFSSPFDRKIPLLSGFIAVYGPSVITWVFMPYVIYGLYGRKHFFRYFSISLIYSAVCFVLYILVPTEAILQREEVAKGDWTASGLDPNKFFDKLTLSTYQAAAPYGEAPSGHWGNSIIIMLGLIKPRDQKKYTKGGLIAFILWGLFGISVCLATMFLKQHNWIDGAITIVTILTIWYLVEHTKVAAKLQRFFTIINVKLGISTPSDGINGIKYDTKRPNIYYVKLVSAWVLFGLIIIWFLIAAWNSSLGGFVKAKVPPWLVPTYGASYIEKNGKYTPTVNPNNNWASWW